MRLLVVNPNSNPRMTALVRSSALAAAAQDTEIYAVNPDSGPDAIETRADEHRAAVATLELLTRTCPGFDAVVIACFGDPGLAAARQLLDVPVLGIAEASMHVACAVARRFSIIAAQHSASPIMIDLADRYGLSARLASVRAIGKSVLEITADPEASRQAIEAAASTAVTYDGAEAVSLGCASMGRLAAELSESLHVPVIDGVQAAVKVAETLNAGQISA